MRGTQGIVSEHVYQSTPATSGETFVRHELEFTRGANARAHVS